MNELPIITNISESDAGTLFLALLLLLLSALVFGKIASLVGLPKVAGEILGGMMVGPTVLGQIFPQVYQDVFFHFSGEGHAISVFYWIGLAFLMFSSGHDSNMEDFKGDKKIIGWLIVGATVLPLVLGYMISDKWFAPHYVGEADNVLVFNIIFAIAAAVTSLPVISKIFMDLGLIRHRFARIILATATIQDLFLWVLLSIATSIINQAKIVPVDIVFHVVVTLAILALALFAAPHFKNIRIQMGVFSYDSLCFIVCFAFIYIGALFGINIMYSAFVAGMVFKNLRREEAAQAHAKVKDICLGFFTPVYFAIVGLRIYVTSDFNVARFVMFLLVVTIIEFTGCILAMRLIKLDWLTSINLGVAMNARGGPGIVLATVTYDLGIINYEFFCVLIFTVLITSAFAGWWIKFVHKKDKLLKI